MGKVTKQISESANILNLLLVIGFLGIVWLMIYGNLSGNLGFPSDSTSFINETINMTGTGEIPATAQGRVNGVLTNIRIYNNSDGVFIESGNYTIVGLNIINTTYQFTTGKVNVSGTVTYDSVSDIQTEAVIGNTTQAVGTFFTFSNTFFTITAIILLITILLGLLAIVLQIVKSTKGKKSGGGFAS